MTNEVQMDLGAIADVETELNAILTNASIDEQTKAILKRYNKILQGKIHALSVIVSQHENKINALEYQLEHK